MAALVLALMLGVAFANGANDVSKGVATLAGSGLATDRQAIVWGTAWTVAGALAAVFIAGGLIALFSGDGILATPPDGPAFLAAVTIGALGWLVIATRTGLPVSTTHALLGGLAGVGVATHGLAGVAWGVVADKAALPLAASPLLSLALVFTVFPAVSAGFRRLNRYCVCVERHETVVAAAGAAARVMAGPELRVVAGADCPPEVVTRVNALDSLHWLSAGFVSFARGLNDAPKIVGLGVAAGAWLGIGVTPLAALVAIAMGAGSLLAGRRVTQTLSRRVTRIAPDDGFAANLVTSLLVGIASSVAAPVSTTHVSTGAIVGIGMHRRDVRWTLVRELLIAWLVTLPVAAALAAGAYSVLASR
ncbi:MAG: inorganic phosphate transporter [Gemmatimonadota bacterium]